jgi:hypothetical protein
MWLANNFEAETVAKAIFSEWFCKYSLLVQIHTDSRKEIVYKFSHEVFQLLNVQHTKNNSGTYSRQCTGETK